MVNVKVTQGQTDGGPFWTFTTDVPQEAGFESWITLNENGDYLAVVRTARASRRTMEVFRDLATATTWVNFWVQRHAKS